MTGLVVLLELERTWGKTVLQRIGDGPNAQLEFRAFDREGRSKGVAITADELPVVVSHLEHEWHTLLGHPKHAKRKA